MTTKMTTNRSISKQEFNKLKRYVQIFIVTAMPIEEKAVKNKLAPLADGITPFYNNYYFGFFGQFLVVHHPIGQANLRAATAITSMLTEFGLSNTSSNSRNSKNFYVFMPGIACGLKRSKDDITPIPTSELNKYLDPNAPVPYQLPDPIKHQLRQTLNTSTNTSQNTSDDKIILPHFLTPESSHPSSNQFIGDILLATSIQQHDYSAIKPNTTEDRGQKYSSSFTRFNLILEHSKLWCQSPDASLGSRQCQVHTGTILSGDLLLNNFTRRQQLTSLYNDAIGLEMEGAALGASIRHFSDQESFGKAFFIFAKSICDWGVGKSDSWQENAANASVSLLLHSLNDPHFFSDIITPTDKLTISTFFSPPPSKKNSNSLSPFSLKKIGVPFFPSLPDKLFKRPKETEDLKNILLTKNSTTEGINNTYKIALLGMGGQGKTTLAKLLANDEDATFQTRFPHGIIWVNLGVETVEAKEDATKPTNKIALLQAALLKKLNIVSINESDISTNKGQLQDYFVNKSCLLILDDVWNSEQLEAFNFLNKDSKILVTTRQSELANNLNSCYSLTNLTDSQAISLLMLYAKNATFTADTLDDPNIQKGFFQLNTNDQSIVKTIVHKWCANLPLGLAICGSIARIKIPKGFSWEDILQLLKSSDATALQTQEEKLIRIIETSIKTLDSKEAELYQQLAVFPPDTIIPVTTIYRFWRHSCDQLQIHQVKNLLIEMDNRSLLRIVNTSPEQMIEFHNLIYICLQHINKEKITTLHNLLLDAYKSLFPQGWHTITDDPYIYQHLTWHMQLANRPLLIHELLTEETSNKNNGWFQTRMQAGQVIGYLDDVKKALHISTKNNDISKEIRYALIIGSINSLSKRIPGELIARLVEEKIWNQDEALRYLQNFISDDIRADAVGNLGNLVDKQSLLDMALNIKNPYKRVDAFVGLAKNKNLSSQEWQTIIQVLQKEFHESPFLIYLNALIEHMPTPIILSLIPIADTFSEIFPNSDIPNQDMLLRMIAIHSANPENLTNSICIANKLKHKPLKLNTLACIAQKVESTPITILQDTLIEIYDSLSEDIGYADALTTLAPTFDRLPTEQRDKALTKTYEVITKLPNKYFKFQQIIQFLPYAPPENKQSLVQEAESILRQRNTKPSLTSVEYEKAIVQLAEFYAKENLIDKAITTIEIIGKEKKTLALTFLLPHTTRTDQAKIIKIIKQQLDPSQQFYLDTIAKLIPYLSTEEKKTYLDKVINEIRIFDVEEQAKFLLMLSILLAIRDDWSKLEEIKTLLEAVDKDYGSLWQMWATNFASLAEFCEVSEVKDKMLDQSVKILTWIPTTFYHTRIETLSKIIPYLEVQQLDQIVTLFAPNLWVAGDYEIGGLLIWRFLQLNCIDKAWELIKTINSDTEKCYYLKFLLKQIKTIPSESIFDEMLSSIENVPTTDVSIGRVITKIIELLAKSQLEKAKIMQGRLKQLHHKFEASISIAKHSPEADRVTLLEKTFQEICRLPIYNLIDTLRKMYLLSKIAPLLPNTLHNEAINKICEESQNINFKASETLLNQIYDTCSENLSTTEQEKIYQILLDKHLGDPKAIETLANSPLLTKLLERSSATQLERLTNEQFLESITQNKPLQSKLSAKAVIEIAKRSDSEKALNLAASIPDLYNWNGIAIGEIACYLSESLQEEAISIVENKVTGSGKAEALTGLLVHVKNNALLERLVDLVMGMSDIRHRARVLEALYSALSNDGTRQKIWKKILHKSLEKSRNEMLSDFTALSLLFSNFSNLCTKEDLQEIFKATQYVMDWWK